MKLHYENLLDEATLTGTGERSGFPLTNTQHPHLSVRWRSIDLAAQYILVDAGVGNTITADMVAVLAHNLTSAATVTFKGNDTDSWASPSLSVTLDPTEELVLERYTSCSHRFFRFDISDTANPDGFIEIGRLWVGGTLEISPSMISDFTVTPMNSDNITHGVTRQKFSDIGEAWLKFEFSFPPTENALIEQLLEMYREIGLHQSLIIAPTDIHVSTLMDSCYVGITQGPTFTHNPRMKWVYSMTFEEEK